MKKNYLLLVLVIFAQILVAQNTPLLINYQGIARNSDGEIITTQDLGVEIMLHEASSNGSVVFTETHSVTTNAFGVFNLQIGGGSISQGDLGSLDLGSDIHFVEISIDFNGGNNYQSMGTSQLISVPYALHAKNAENVFSGNYSDLQNKPSNLSDFSNDSGFITNPNDADANATNEIQDISLTGNNLSISSGSTVDLSTVQDGFEANTDAQSLSLSGTDLSISGGNTLDISGLKDGYEANTDNQLASEVPIDAITGLNSSNVQTALEEIQSGISTISVDDADADATNEIQDLSLVGSTLKITNNASATEINLAPFSGTNTDEQVLNLTGTDLSISNGNIVDLSALQDGVDDADADATNEIQDISLTGNDLTISSGSTVDLSTIQDGYEANTDAQSLSLSGTDLSISGGNTLDISALQDGFEENTDNQNLILTTNTLSLTNDATTVDLSGYLDNTDAQNLSLTGTSLAISGGNTINVSALQDGFEANTDNQTLSFNGTNVTIAGGNAVDISTLGSQTLPRQIISANTTIDNTSQLVFINGIQELKLPAAPDQGQILHILGGHQNATINPNGRNFKDGSNFLGVVTLSFLDMVGGSGTVTIIYSNTTWNFFAKSGNAGASQTISLSGTDLSISDGNTIDLATIQDGVNDADADATNEIQDLTLTGSTLKITNNASATGIDLSPFAGTNTDEQTLALAGTTLTISNGNNVNLAAVQDGFEANTDAQTLSLAGSTLSILGGNSVNLPAGGGGTDDQTIDIFSLSGTTLSISLEADAEADKTVDLSSLQDGFEANTDEQNLSLTGSSISISGGNSIDIDGVDDNQIVDILSLSGTTLSVSLQGDGVANKTVNLSSLQDGFEANTDGQTLSLAGSTLSISGGNSVNLPAGGGGTDDQTIDIFSLSGTTLSISLEADAEASKIVDLSSLQDGFEANTDAQNLSLVGSSISISGGNSIDIDGVDDNQIVDVLSLTGTTLSVSLQGDGVANKTVNLSSLQDGYEANTDAQTLSLVGSTLSILGGNSVNLPAGGGGTDDQTIDVFSLSGTTLSISLEADAEASKTVSLASLQDGTGTDDQIVDVFSLSGNTLSLSLEGDGQLNNTVDLSSFAGTVSALNDLSDAKTNTESVFIGINSGQNDDNSNFNTAVGHNSLQNNSSGQNNIAIGNTALNTNSFGNDNVAVGFSSLKMNTTSSSTAIGSNALENSTNADGNTAIGHYALNQDVNGNRNVALGKDAGRTATGSSNIFIGYEAGENIGAGNDQLYIDNTNTSDPLIKGNFATNRLFFNANVSVGFGNITPTQTFQVGTNGDGTSAVANSWNTFSDRRWKKNIVTLNNGLNKVMALRGVTYNWKSTENEDLGFIAQEVEEVLPLLVKTGKDGYKSVDYARITAVLVEAVKELKNQIDALNNENKQLNTQLTQLDQLKKEVKMLSNILLTSKNN